MDREGNCWRIETEHPQVRERERKRRECLRRGRELGNKSRGFTGSTSREHASKNSQAGGGGGRMGARGALLH